MNRVSSRSDDGTFIFCDVPQGTRLVAWADALGLTSPRAEFFFDGGEAAREDLVVMLSRVMGAVSGRILDDTTEQPIGGATVRIPGVQASTLTNSNGRFRLTEVPVGTYDLLIGHVGYGEPRFTVSIENAMSTHTVIRLEPQVIAVEPISVEITARAKWLEDNGFYRRLESRLGSFVTPREVDAQRHRSFAEVLRTIPAVNMRHICAPHCQYYIQMAGQTMRGCIPTFYVDGRRVNQLTDPDDGSIDLDTLAFGSDIAAVEVYRGISETPPEFYGRCGSIVLWTRRGGG